MNVEHPVTRADDPRLVPIVRRLYADAPRRSVMDTPPTAEIAELASLGLGGARAQGTEGDLRDLAAILIELAAADPNVVQVFRAHLGLAETVRLHPDPMIAASWAPQVAAPGLIASAASERGGTNPYAKSTVVSEEGDVLRVTGRKYYCTGSTYADRLLVMVKNEHGEVRDLLVDADAHGVDVIDDWDGFGQRHTGSGTVRLHHVRVARTQILPHDVNLDIYVNAFHQFVIAAIQAGIIRRCAADFTELIAQSRRVFPTASAATLAADPLAQETLGSILARDYSATATVHSLADDLDRSALSQETAAYARAADSSARAQHILTELVGEVTWRAFNATGASATQLSRALERHWLNGRTVSSHNPVVYKTRDIGAYALGEA